jgi:hypothetical protein
LSLDYFKWAIGGSEQMRLTSTGLGIGTSSPAQKLSVYYSANTDPTLTANAFAPVSFNNAGVELTYGVYTSSPFAAWLQAKTGGGAWPLAINPLGGNVGVGTNAPAAKLDVNGTIYSRTGGIYSDTLSAYSGSSLSINAGSSNLNITVNGSERARIDSSGNLLVGTTSAGGTKLTVAGAISATSGITAHSASKIVIDQPSSGSSYIRSYGANTTTAGELRFVQASSDYSVTYQSMFDAVGNLLVGTTTKAGNANTFYSATAGQQPVSMWNGATSGNNYFFEFGTEGTYTARGSITYNRGAGLVAYNVTSDYRAKEIYGPVADSGALIDSVPVYMGKMKGATQERPMFIAHETPDYAHTGEKDAVDDDGNPLYQQMDASALIPVMWAEIQSLRKRLAAAGI